VWGVEKGVQNVSGYFGGRSQENMGDLGEFFYSWFI
jgi:hypothetical protein